MSSQDAPAGEIAHEINQENGGKSDTLQARWYTGTHVEHVERELLLLHPCLHLQQGRRQQIKTR
jgi:hypothetical protein